MDEIEQLVEGIKKDESLRNILCEREDCYIDMSGDLCVIDDEDNFDEVIQSLRESGLAFDGQHFGLEPDIKKVDTQTVNDVMLRLKSSNEDDANTTSETENTEAKQRLQRLLELALRHGYSDIHIRIDDERKRTQISGRLDGEFVELMGDQDAGYGMAVCAYAAVTVGKVQTFSIQSQADATFEMETAVTEKDSRGKSNTYRKKTKWRLSQIKINEGTKVTIRALETGGNKLPDLYDLGLTPGQVDAFVWAVNGAQGATLMSGPTGSGKTTTINCALQTIKPTRYVHSLEDPVEFNRPGRNHFATRVNEEHEDQKTKKRRMSFEHYGKTLLRHDTDVLYFGEVRDKEAAAQFMRLATTGQVMVGTIHCNSAISIITTVAEQLKVPITQLAAPGILKALAQQRLVRELCHDCKIPFAQAEETALKTGDDDWLKAIAEIRKIGEQENKTTEHVCFKNPQSRCKTCNGKGEKGRTAVFELIVIDDVARGFIRELRLNEWLEHLKEQNWPSIADHAKAKVLNGIVDYRSVSEQVDGLVERDMANTYTSMHLEVAR